MAWKTYKTRFSETILKFDVDESNAQHSDKGLREHEQEVCDFWLTHPVSHCDDALYVEIGACFGETAMMNVLIGNFQKAILVEPVNHVQLSKALSATFSDDSRFEILPVAIGAKPEEFGFSRVNPGGATPTRYLARKRRTKTPPEKAIKPATRPSLPTEHMDRPASLAWMDCQGGEEYIFENCQRQLGEMFPLLMVEVHGFIEKPERFLENLQSVYAQCQLRTKRSPSWGGLRRTADVAVSDFKGQKWAQFLLWDTGYESGDVPRGDP